MERLLADDVMKRVIVDDLVVDHGWDREAAWTEVRAVDDAISKARTQAANDGVQLTGDEFAGLLAVGAMELLMNSLLD